MDDEIDLVEIDEFFDSMNRKETHQSQKEIQSKWIKNEELPECTELENIPMKRPKNEGENRTNKNTKYLKGKEGLSTIKLCYNLKKKAAKYTITEVNGKKKCPFC